MAYFNKKIDYRLGCQKVLGPGRHHFIGGFSLFIISKANGIFNTDSIPCIKFFPSGTYATFGDGRILISEENIVDEISMNIKLGYTIMEVQ